MSDETSTPEATPEATPEVTAETQALQAAQQELLKVKHERDQLMGTYERFSQGVAAARQSDPAFASRLQHLWSTGELPPTTPEVAGGEDEVDLTDPSQLANFIKQTIQSEVQPMVAPLHKKSLETQTTTEYMRLANRVGQDNLEAAMPAMQQLIADQHLTLDSLPGGLEAIYKLATYDHVAPRAIEQFQAQERQRAETAAGVSGLPAHQASGPAPDVQKRLESLPYNSDEFNDILRQVGTQMGMKE